MANKINRRKRKNRSIAPKIIAIIAAIIAAVVIVSFLRRGANPGGNVGNSQVSSGSVSSTDGENMSVKNTAMSDFYYEQLNDGQKKVYSEIKEALLSFQTDFDVSNIPVDDFSDVMHAFTYDNPDIFWARSHYTLYSSNNMSESVEINIPPNAKDAYIAITNISDEVIAGMPDSFSEYEKVKYIYDWIVDNVDYAAGERDQDVRSVFIDRASVCNGYASAFQLLCNKAGIGCTTVSGEAMGELHAWNLVYIDNEPYWSDVTWGDPVFLDSSNTKMKSNYIYLCMSDDEIFKTHYLNTKLMYERGREWTYPKCTSNKYNYYRLNGMYFENFDEKAISDYIAEKSAGKKESNIEMMFGTQEAYKQANVFLFENNGLSKIIQSTDNTTGNFWYSQHDESLHIQLRIELDL